MHKAPSLEAIYRDFSPKGVSFYYLYKALAHPETNGYVAPFTLDERLMHLKEAERTLGSQITWLCDTPTNDIKHALGDAPNSEFIVDSKGTVIVRRGWSDPQQLRQDLEKLVGPVEHATEPSDVKLGDVHAPKVAPTGIVTRVDVPGRMKPLRIEPKPSDTPFYAKLRAEADENFLEADEGTLYLGFHMDPLYHVHWNNLAAPIQYELVPPKGIVVSPANGEGPDVEEPADNDPREFLVHISRTDVTKPIELTVKYFACNDEEGWCIPVTQQYFIYLETDPDGGSVRTRSRPRKRNRRYP